MIIHHNLNLFEPRWCDRFNFRFSKPNSLLNDSVIFLLLRVSRPPTPCLRVRWSSSTIKKLWNLTSMSSSIFLRPCSSMVWAERARAFSSLVRASTAWEAVITFWYDDEIYSCDSRQIWKMIFVIRIGHLSCCFHAAV